MVEIKGGAGVSLAASNGELFVNGYVPGIAEFTVFVAKTGDDTNSGSSLDSAKLTIGGGLAAAADLLAASATAVRIEVGGAGRYAENIAVPQNVIIVGLAATIVGQIEIHAGARVIIYAHYASQNDQTMLVKSGAGGGWFTTFRSDGRGLDGTLTGVVNAKSEVADSIMFFDAALVFVTANGKGIEDSSAGFGHAHINIKDLYLAGDNAAGIRLVGGQSDGVGYLDHILEIGGSWVGTVGIRVGNNSIGRFIACEIVATTAWSAGVNGDLFLICPRVVGITDGTLSNV